jgi:hypothetical protein
MSKKPKPLAARSKPFLLTGLLIATVGISGCSSVPVDSGCRSFKPIGWSKADTEPTKRAVVAHNKVFDAICPNS